MTTPDPSSSVRAFRYDDIATGRIETRDYEITPVVFQHFLDAFCDHSPVHVNEAFAKSRGFEGQVMPGGILHGFVSHFIGVYFPGQYSLLLSANLRYSSPSYLRDIIRVEMTVHQKMDTGRILVLSAVLSNITRKTLAARGRIQVMIKKDA